MDENQVPGREEYGIALRLIRRRRNYLFATILVYIPALVVTYRISPTDRAMGTVFVIWLVFLIVTMLVSAIARCPKCGNYFHVNGMTLLYLRRCLHCQLHINADREKKAEKAFTTEDAEVKEEKQE